MTSATNHRLAMQELKAQEKAARKAEKERQKRVARDEAAERRRAAKSGFANVANPRRSTLMTVLCSIFAIYCLFPFVYLLINATKSQADFTSTFGLWFGGEFNLWDNIVTVFTYQDGIFARWFLNTILYVVVGAGGATLLAIMGGYALAKFRFPGRKLCFWLIFITLMLPVEVRISPTYEVMANLNLLDSWGGLILPVIASATATFLFRQFFLTVPDELTEAARMDGAGPMRFFFTILLPLSMTNVAAMFVIQFIYGWNQYLWPLLVTTSEDMYPIVIGIKRMIGGGDSANEWNLIMATAMLAMIPPALVVTIMQRWFVKGLVDTEK